MVPLLGSQMARFPGIRLLVQEGSGGQIDQWLSNGLVDIGLTYRYGRKVASDTERLVRVGSFLVGPPGDPLTRGKTIEFRRLDRLPLVLPSGPSAVRLLLGQLAARAGIVLNVVMEAGSARSRKGRPPTQASTRCCRCMPWRTSCVRAGCRHRASSSRASTATSRWP